MKKTKTFSLEKPKEGDLKVWWIPQIPGTPFEVPVRSLEEAAFLITTLADYDLFQLEQNIKPDYSNVGGLMRFENGEWFDYENEDGYSIDQLIADGHIAVPKIQRPKSQIEVD